MGFATDAIHAGQKPDPATGAIVVPIYQTSTYVQEELGKHKGYQYARAQNPTREALEAKIAALEGGRRGIAFASGMAAINALLTLFEQGDHVLVSERIYGGTYRLFERVLRKFGLNFSWVDTTRTEQVAGALRQNTRLVFVETPANPVMEVSDIRAICELAHSHSPQLLVAVDNTFLSPYLQRPLELGADVSLHSTTKFLNGHSDGVGGILVVKDEELARRLYFVQNAGGAILGPFDSWLVLRGTKTLAVRMRRHDENGRAVAEFLSQHSKVKEVHYPGLPTHPQHEVARRQQHGFGSMISFETGSLDRARSVLNRVRLCSLAESLGAVETLISHPATMSHASLSPELRVKLGVTDGLVRISVGLEDVEDLWADLDQALS